MECLLPFNHHPDAKRLLALAHTLQKGLLSLPILANTCEFCAALSLLNPKTTERYLNSALTAVSAECAYRAHQRKAVMANGRGYFLAPHASVFQVAATCPTIGTPLGPCNVLHAFREFLQTAPALSQIFSHWCDANRIYSWFNVRLSTINSFIDCIVTDIHAWVSMASAGPTPSFLSTKWYNALYSALHVCSKWSPFFTLGPMLPALHTHPLSHRLRSLPSVYTPDFCTATQTWYVQWDLVRRIFRSVIGRGNQSHQCLVLPSTPETIRKILMIAHLTKSHTHRLAEDLCSPDLFSGLQSDTRFILWVISSSPLHPHTRQRAIAVLQPMCKTASGFPSPQADLIHSLFASGEHCTKNPPYPNEPPAVAQEPFTDLWHRETQIRRDALAPSWNQHTRRVVHKKQWPAIFRSWDRVNQNLHSATPAHLRKLHAMRLTTQSVFTPGCWVYALWHIADGRVYVGQTGGRANLRSVAERGREHVRLAADFLRLNNGRRLWLPQSVYRWMMQRGPENFVITPLESCPPDTVTQRERFWMLKWGVGKLFNIDIPSLSNNRWDFLQSRKVWKKELEDKGGSYLSYARSILAAGQYIPPDRHPPPLLLAVLQSTSRYLPSSDHKRLFDMVASLFARQFHVKIPYRITLKIPLMTTADKKHLHQKIATVIDTVDAWPPYLRSYLSSRIFIVSRRTPSVFAALSQQPVATCPTPVLDDTPAPQCPCSKWLKLPGVGSINGHAVFRDPRILETHCDSRPTRKRCDTSIFQQNMKNAVVPSLKSLKHDLVDSLRGLATSIPDHQTSVAHKCIADIASTCATTYHALASSHPKTVYEPYIKKHGQRLPDGIVCTVLDKAPQVPIFCCANVWRHIHSTTFLQSGRFQELSRFPTQRDAQCWLYWELADSISLSVRGEYCAFSVLHGVSPLPAKDLALAYQTYLSYPSSPHMKRNLSPLLDGCCTKLKLWGPSASQLLAPGAPTTTALLHRAELKALANHTTLLPDPSLPTPTQKPGAGPPPQRGQSARRGRAPCRPTIPPLRRVSAAGVTQRRRSGRPPPILALDEQWDAAF